MAAGGKNPILGLAIEAALSPTIEFISQNRMEWYRFLRRFGLAFTHYAVDDRSRHVHRALSKINVTPLEGK